MAAAAGTQAAASASKPQSDTLDPQHKRQLDTGHRDTSSSLFSTHRHTRNLSDFSDIFLDTALSPAHTDAFKGEATLQPQARLDLQGERPASAHSLGDLSPFTSQLSPSDSVAGTHALSSANIEESFEQALLMGDQGAFSNGQSQGSPFPYDASGLGYNAMQSPPVGQQQVPQFSISQQNLDGTMTTTHTTADGAELAAASGARNSRHASPFEVATAPMQPPTQPQLSPGLHFALGDPYANGLDVPSPYSDTASFVGSDIGDGGSPHLDILRLSRTNSMNSAFRPDLGYLYSHPPSPFIEHSDASASQPPPPLQPNHAQQSFAYLQPGASPHNATHMSPQMAQMSFNNQNSYTATPPVAIRLEQPSNAYGDYTPGISLTPSGHATLDMSHHGGNNFNFIPGMPLITTSLHHHDDSHETGGVSALERALQEQQQKQLDQLRQHHLQQQQTLLGVEDAARRGRSLSDSGMERYGPIPVRRDGSHGSARGRSRDGRSSHSHRGSSSGSHSPHTHGARRPSFNQGAFPGVASVAGATPGLLGSELRAHSPNPRSGSAGHIGVNTGPGGKHVRRSSWSGQRQGGLSPRDVSPSGSSVHSFVAGDNKQSAQQQQQPHAKAKNPATFICPVAGCNKAFTRAYNLRSHQRTHTNERPFLCEVCGKAFARQHDRKRHEALHSGVKAHACPGCNKKFARMDALSRHFKSETGKDCIEGREEYARYVDGQASAEQQDGYVDDENASQGMSASDLGLDFEGEGYVDLY